MKKYRYDPILCMNVPDSTSKANDASWKAWTLYIDGKWVKSFNSSMAPIKEAQKFMKENYPGKVGKLSRNTGSSSGYSISGNEYKDEAPAEMREAARHRATNDFGEYKFKIVYGKGKAGEKEEVISASNVNEARQHAASKAGGWGYEIVPVKDAKSIDKAIKTCDKFTVWESDDYDDIYVSYENGTYVLYVDGRPQADGPQQRMIQLAKQEERMRD